MNKPPRQPPRLSRLVAGWCALLLYTVAAFPAGPAFTALLASFDSDHHILIASGRQGVQLILRHDCENPPAHRHGPVARALVLLARRSAPEQPDHVIQFGSASVSERTFSANVQPSLNADEVVKLPALSKSSFPSPSSDFSFNATPPSPPGARGLPSFVRSTVLLI